MWHIAPRKTALCRLEGPRRGQGSPQHDRRTGVINLGIEWNQVLVTCQTSGPETKSHGAFVQSVRKDGDILKPLLKKLASLVAVPILRNLADAPNAWQKLTVSLGMAPSNAIAKDRQAMGRGAPEGPLQVLVIGLLLSEAREPLQASINGIAACGLNKDALLAGAAQQGPNVGRGHTKQPKQLSGFGGFDLLLHPTKSINALDMVEASPLHASLSSITLKIFPGLLAGKGLRDTHVNQGGLERLNLTFKGACSPCGSGVRCSLALFTCITWAVRKRSASPTRPGMRLALGPLSR